AVPERLGESGVIEDPDVSLAQKRGHPSRKTDLRQGSENQHPVPATQHTRDLVPVPFRQQLDGHFGIIASPVWFRLCRVRSWPSLLYLLKKRMGIWRLRGRLRINCAVSNPPISG